MEEVCSILRNTAVSTNVSVSLPVLPAYDRGNGNERRTRMSHQQPVRGPC